MNLLASDFRLRLREPRLGLLNLRAGLGQLRQRLLTLHLEIPRIQPGEQLAGGDRLVLLHQHFADRSGQA